MGIDIKIIKIVRDIKIKKKELYYTVLKWLDNIDRSNLRKSPEDNFSI